MLVPSRRLECQCLIDEQCFKWHIRVYLNLGISGLPPNCPNRRCKRRFAYLPERLGHFTTRTVICINRAPAVRNEDHELAVMWHEVTSEFAAVVRGVAAAKLIHPELKKSHTSKLIVAAVNLL